MKSLVDSQICSWNYRSWSGLIAMSISLEKAFQKAKLKAEDHMKKLLNI